MALPPTTIIVEIQNIYKCVCVLVLVKPHKNISLFITTPSRK